MLVTGSCRHRSAGAAGGHGRPQEAPGRGGCGGRPGPQATEGALSAALAHHAGLSAGGPRFCSGIPLGPLCPARPQVAGTSLAMWLYQESEGPLGNGAGGRGGVQSGRPQGSLDLAQADPRGRRRPPDEEEPEKKFGLSQPCAWISPIFLFPPWLFFVIGAAPVALLTGFSAHCC